MMPPETNTAPSLWASLFEGFKRLFNMQSNLDEPAANRNDIMRNSHARNSAHRGFALPGSGSIVNSAESAIKQRHSILQNAQLELTRVN